MNIPLHPALVHLPLGVAIALPLVAVGLTLAIRAGRLPRTSFGVVVALLLLVVGGGFTAMAAGEREAARVERVVGEQAVEAHEEVAEAFVWTAAAVLVVAVAALAVPARWAAGVALLATLGTVGVAGLGFVAGKRGGELVYGHGAIRAYLEPGAPAGQGVAPAPASHERED
ncbi:MAG: hypothetical protein QM767_25280 [Anaeromyxobacter sp.]